MTPDRSCKNCGKAIVVVKYGEPGRKTFHSTWMHIGSPDANHDYRPTYYQHCKLQVAQP